MINSGYIKIGDEPQRELAELGIYIADMDKYFTAPQMDMEEQYYPELGKSIIYPHAPDKPFDWKIKIGVVDNVNPYINYLKAQAKGKRIEIVDLHMKAKIVGYLLSIPPASDFFRTSTKEAATFEITIKVNDPSLCNFNLP